MTKRQSEQWGSSAFQLQEDIRISKSAGIKGIWLPESAPLYSQLQQDGQGQVLVLKGNVAFGAGTSMYITGPKQDKTWRLREDCPTHLTIHRINHWSVDTNLRNLVALSTTSSHTDDTVPSSNSVASGRARRASRDSWRSSLQRSASSPIKHKLLFYMQTVPKNIKCTICQAQREGTFIYTFFTEIMHISI